MSGTISVAARGGLAGLVLMLATAAASATTPAMPTRVTCPLTGAPFGFTGDYGSFPSFGRSLDFEPLVMGMLRASPRRIPQCPGSGLPVHRDFSPAEIAKLKAAVATRAWAERRRVDSPFYLVAYVEQVLGGDETTVAQALLQAVWGATAGNKALLVGKALDAWSHVADTRRQHDGEWVAAKWLRVELTRQKGEFGQADRWLSDFVQKVGAGHPPVSDDMIAAERQLIAARNPDPAAAPQPGRR